MRNAIRNSLRRFLGESGAASVELVIVFPIFFTIFVSAFELGMMNLRAVMLERATDITVRAIRVNQGADLSYEDVRDAVCELSFMIPNCNQVVKIEMTPVDKTVWGTMPRQVDCIDRTENIAPVVSFENGIENELMLVRVCAVIDPFFPTVGIGRSMPKDRSGGYIVTASSAFVNEPD